MPYKNGREAKNGDSVIWVDAYGGPVSGILYDIPPDGDSGKIAIRGINNDPAAAISECLHADDVKNGFYPPDKPEA